MFSQAAIQTINNSLLHKLLTLSKDILPRSPAALRTAPFKRHVKCHCLKSASITADIVKRKVPYKGWGGGGWIKLINSTGALFMT